MNDGWEKATIIDGFIRTFYRNGREFSVYLSFRRSLPEECSLSVFDSLVFSEPIVESVFPAKDAKKIAEKIMKDLGFSQEKNE